VAGTRLEPLLDGGVEAGTGRITPLCGRGKPADVAVRSQQGGSEVDVGSGIGAAQADAAVVAIEGVGEVVVSGEVEKGPQTACKAWRTSSASTRLSRR
jgi:hypothetical protein